MITNTITSKPPDIMTMFDPNLLMTTLERKKSTLLKIVNKAIRKYRNCHGKKKQFDQLYEKVCELYGIKTDEEIEYQAKTKEACQRTSLPIKGTTMRFTRLRSE